MIGFNVESLDFVFDGSVENFPLESVVSYVRSAINLSGCEGSVGAELHAEGNIRDIESMTISGSVGVEEFVAKDVRGDNLLSLSAMNVGITELNIERQRYIFSSMTASGYSTQLLLNSDGTTNFDQLFYGGTVKSAIEKGLLVLVGIEDADTEEDIQWLCKKIVGLRVFDDEQGVMNRSILESGGKLYTQLKIDEISNLGAAKLI